MSDKRPDSPLVIIVILNWNNAPDTIACLESVGQLDYTNHRVLVVDNGSTDGSAGRIRQAHSSTPILETGQNLGYAGGNNVGIRAALEQDVSYVCLLNNDTEIRPDFLAHLVAEAEADPSIGIVGPKMYFFEPPDMIFAAGSLVDWDRGKLNQRGVWQRESAIGPLYSERPEDVDFIIGCGVLFRREVFEAVGLLDERYYLNFEDVDICVRARRDGYRVRYTPQAVLYHRVSASLGRASPRNTYYMTRNAILFFATHLHGWRCWRALASIVVRELAHILAWTVKPRYWRTARSNRNANLLALRDAALKRFGQAGVDLEVVCQRN